MKSTLTQRRHVGRRIMLVAVLGVMLVASAASAAGYQDRFVWVFGWNLEKDGDVAEIGKILEDGAKHGINGAVLSAGLDSMSRKSPEYFRRLEEVKKTCERLSIELIPSVFSVGYGGSVLGVNRMLAEGVPVRDAVFLAGDGEAKLVADRSVQIVNGGFEEIRGVRLQGFNFHDEPGKISFVDEQVKHSGRSSVRLENFQSNPHGHGRVMQEIRVRPHRCYRMSLWVKTEGLAPANAFHVQVLSGNRNLAPRQFNVPATGDWRKITTLINSQDCQTIRLYAGVWQGKGGRLWLDDWTIEEVEPINVLRRPGTPVSVRSEDGATTYVEGQDYARLEDPRLNFYNVDREAPALRLLPGGRIGAGQRLLVSWYHPMVVNSSQITICMGEPQLYEIYEREAKLMAERLRPRRVLLNMDEVRMGGTCQACAGRDMAQLLGECVTRQVQILRRNLPEAQVYVWSDMFDPNHNARGDYYLVKGSFANSWKHVPRDLVMAVWGGEPREKSLRFLADEGFSTLVACYYDADDLNDVRRWMKAAAGLPKVRGFMYTPWQKKYQLLGEFGDLVRGGQ